MLVEQDLIDDINKFIKYECSCRENPNVLTKIQLAVDLSIQVHQGQLRKTGDPYLVHPFSVAKTLYRKFGDCELMISAILHDVVEDSENIDIGYIYETFGENIGFIVDSVTKTIRNYHVNPDFVFEDKIGKLLHGGLLNIKCLLLKIADREHNLNSIDNLKSNKQIRMAFETQAIYYPLKGIIDYDSSNNVKLCEKYFNEYIKDNAINSYQDLKNSLYNTSYKNFNNDIYDLVYKNTNIILWQINDKEMLGKLLQLDTFNHNINIVSLEQIGDAYFSCIFNYNKGDVFGDIGLQMQIASFTN